MIGRPFPNNKWLSRDPIPDALMRLGMLTNPDEYCRDNPLALTDQMGLDPYFGNSFFGDTTLNQLPLPATNPPLPTASQALGFGKVVCMAE